MEKTNPFDEHKIWGLLQGEKFQEQSIYNID